ncbi:hypothetical protein [Streptacidiphilus albus]|uniref:hypothetical protein n=1 Tax=Streptacidiphilus albus TaxID=105425 RepID=UPI00054C19CD|nr:hypothetical protein [Streptacidiphilus albus]
MRTRWEYLLVRYQVALVDVDGGRQDWREDFLLTWPGNVPPETRSASDVHWSALLAEVGADGWELVGDSIQETAIFPSRRGMLDINAPIKIVFTFKRPVE